MNARNVTVLWFCWGFGTNQEHREDTRLELSHFQKHRRKLVKKVQGKNGDLSSRKPADKNAPGKDSSGSPIAKALGKAAELAGGAKVRKVTINSQFWLCPVRWLLSLLLLDHYVFTEKLMHTVVLLNFPKVDRSNLVSSLSEIDVFHFCKPRSVSPSSNWTIIIVSVHQRSALLCSNKLWSLQWSRTTLHTGGCRMWL